MKMNWDSNLHWQYTTKPYAAWVQWRYTWIIQYICIPVFLPLHSFFDNDIISDCRPSRKLAESVWLRIKSEQHSQKFKIKKKKDQLINFSALK